MIVKMFKHGTGSASGVFNYLLGKDNNREDAELLRGDVDTQKLLIDSLSFKQKYTSGCLSFEEAPDQISERQKADLMDGFEKTITAGLDDRISMTWIEHRDKGRLELNFVIANIDLKHGRLFQPYVHSQDLKRVNAWKDIQNIEQGFTDPNDPKKKRILGQRDNLPRDIKEVRELINKSLKEMVADGLITNRDDVAKALKDNDFKITRQTNKSISIENPDPDATRPIRLTGVLYERAFKFSAEIRNEVISASEDYRGSDRERLSTAKQVYEREISRKQDYHRQRHHKPKQKHEVDIRLRDTMQRLDRRLTFEAPNPYERKLTTAQATDESDHERSFREYEYNRDRQANTLHKIDDYKAMGSRIIEPVTNGTWLRERFNVGIMADAKTVTRSDAGSTTSELRHDSASVTNAGRQRQTDSRVKQLIEAISDATIRVTAEPLAEAKRVIDNALRELQCSDSQARHSYSTTAAHDRDREAFEVIGSATKRVESIASSKQDLIQEAIEKYKDVKNYQPILSRSDWGEPNLSAPTATLNPEPDPRDNYDARQLDIINSIRSSDSLKLSDNKHIVAMLVDPEADHAEHSAENEITKHETVIESHDIPTLEPTLPTPAPYQRPRL
ncbi:relaxase/mobilization nuclease domain-containing protein [Psychrobacter sp. Ps4]|uniref:relaxase/mobilization nuclease domain-containing protein n=1 Tax=Psychrobacter sp. Ps4 TaxID=2790958 RepID=UPI001EDD1B65|nr:relaxase/mobilization nuclease domain-containing protein [Psychrobacter sp. Ps4]MCG3810127.1 relaxase/mobilization nuclease domain-containing protein [Psychrobacter sp. Ps4]